MNFTNAQKVHISRSIFEEVNKILPKNLTEDEHIITKLILGAVATAILLLPSEDG